MDPAVAACDGLLSAGSIAAVTGADVNDSRAGFSGNLNLPDSPSCDWTLSDGSSIHVGVSLDISGFEPGDISKAMAFGGQTVESLPQPAASVIYNGEGQVIAGRVGPLLTESLIFRARSADGKADDLDLLERLALASAAQPAPASTVDPECAARLGVPVVSTQRYEAPSAEYEQNDLHCGYDLGDGKAAVLALRWTGPNSLPDCCEKVKELGKGAFASQNGSGKKAPWTIEWVLATGDPARTAKLSNGGGATKQLSKKELVALARSVTLGETVGSAPTPTPVAGTGPSAEAAALLGTWAFQEATHGTDTTAPPAGLGVTANFAADGTMVVAVDCKPYKHKKAVAYPGTYTADATTVHVKYTNTTGACADSGLQDFLATLSILLGFSTQPGTWSVVGDTLTITGGPQISLVFQRAVP
jgi:hypothetical protein